MADRPTFSRSHLAFALGVICFANFLNYLDRQLVSILAEPIKRDLGLSDTQLGMVTGFDASRHMRSCWAVSWRTGWPSRPSANATPSSTSSTGAACTTPAA